MQYLFLYKKKKNVLFNYIELGNVKKIIENLTNYF